ncbi:MAG: hypothetical protein AAF414_23985 [Pseudomonadota bacterium]
MKGLLIQFPARWAAMPLAIAVVVILSACVSGGKQAPPDQPFDNSTAIAIAQATNVGGRMSRITQQVFDRALVDYQPSGPQLSRDERDVFEVVAFTLVQAATESAAEDADLLFADDISRSFSAREQSVVLGFANSSFGRSTLNELFGLVQQTAEAEVSGLSVDMTDEAIAFVQTLRGQPPEVVRYLGLTIDAVDDFALFLERNIETLGRALERTAA